MKPLPPSDHRRLRGSALLAVILTTTLLAVIGASLIGWSLTEHRLNIRNALRLEALNAAEALAEYGVSQIRQKFETRSTFDLKPTGSDALVYPPDSFWTGSNVLAAVPITVDTTQSDYSTTKLELIGGKIKSVTTGSSDLYYVDPADPSNKGNAQVGQWVFRRDVSVLARATVAPKTGNTTPITAYLMENMTVFGAPLFANAIFYNMDLEIFPGPSMTISGPVHTNGSLYLYPKADLNFTDAVTATGGIYHAAKSNDKTSDGLTGYQRTGAVNFTNSSNSLINLYKSDGNYWQDSTRGMGPNGSPWADFGNVIDQLYNGKVKTGDDPYNPVAIASYKEQTSPTIDNSVNSGRVIIEPSNYPVSSDPDYTTKMMVEKQKYANDAGIYIQVTPGTGAITITSRSKLDPSKNKLLTLPAGSNFVTYTPYTVDSSGVTVTGGMYDQDRKKGIDLITINMDALRNIVTRMSSNASNAQYIDSSGSSVTADNINVLGNLTPADWTGIVYVEVTGGPSTDPITGSTIAAPNPAAMNTGVLITNGAQKLPSYGDASPGLTIATNDPVYIKGNYNADGNITPNTNGSANPYRDPETGEVPAAIAADAITLLSSGFDSKSSKSSFNPNVTTPSLEISSAFLTGITPTNKNNNGQSSGGAHNLPRFLENWSNKPTDIRGSLVCLFESRIFTEPYTTAGYYSAPVRNWGFNRLFSQGKYPPGTPTVQSYFRIGYTKLDVNSYNYNRTQFESEEGL